MRVIRQQLPAAVEFLAGVLGGLLVGLLGGAIGGRAGAMLAASRGDWSDLVGAIFGAAGGYLLGAATGVALAGRRRARRGSFWAALLGGFAGAALALIAAGLLGLNVYPALLQGVFLLLTPLGAVLAFHALMRRV